MVSRRVAKARAFVVVSMTCMGSSALRRVGMPCISSGGAAASPLLQDGTLALFGARLTKPAAHFLRGSGVSGLRDSLVRGLPWGVRSHLTLIWTTSSETSGEKSSNSPAFRLGRFAVIALGSGALPIIWSILEISCFWVNLPRNIVLACPSVL